MAKQRLVTVTVEIDLQAEGVHPKDMADAVVEEMNQTMRRHYGVWGARSVHVNGVRAIKVEESK